MHVWYFVILNVKAMNTWIKCKYLSKISVSVRWKDVIVKIDVTRIWIEISKKQS